MRRRITANERCGAPEWHVAVDCETRPDGLPADGRETTHLLWIGWACRWRQVKGQATRREWFRFTESRAFWEWLYDGLPDRKTTWVWAHYAAYDLLALKIGEEIAAKHCGPAYRYREAHDAGDDDPDGPTPEGLICLNDPPTILDMEAHNGRRFVCLDLMNWLPVSLAVVGESVGLPKSPDPGDESGEDYWDARCRQDVRIVQAAVSKLRRWQLDNDLGNLRYTASSQSLALWRHRCMDCNITWGHDARVKLLERASYYPGLLRANWIGAPVENVYRLDVNSCYPHVMRGNDYPVKWIGAYQCVSIKQALAYLDVYEGVARCTLTSRSCPYPVRTPAGVRWSIGSISTTLCGPDLRGVIAAGHLTAIGEMNVYQRGRPFDSFVQAVLDLRAGAEGKSDRAFAKLAKNIANALHGKFAQWSQGWRLEQHACPPTLWGHYFEKRIGEEQTRVYRSIGGHAQRQLPRTERDDSFPLIAAYVSAYARRHVADAVALCGERQVFYQDVDSIHVSQAAFDRLEGAGMIHPTEAGKFKVEAFAKSAEWRGPKNYRFDDKWTVSGVSPRAYLDGKGQWLQTNFHRLDTCFNGEPPDGPVTQDVPVPEPRPRLEGRIRDGGWLEYPVEGV